MRQSHVTPFQAFDGVVAMGMSDRCLTLVIGRWEGRVDRVESIPKKRIVHRFIFPIRPDDVDLLQSDDLIRRNTRDSPIPERYPEVPCYGCPVILIRILFGNVEGCFLHRLLCSLINIWRNKTSYNNTCLV